MKILVAIASYGAANDKYLSRLIQEYRSMSYHVDIVVLSNVRKDWISGTEVLVGLPTKDPWSLPFAHKQVFADRVSNYDLFIYSEDDTLITEKNIRAFLQVSAALPPGEIAGFLRFERVSDGRVNYPEIHGHFHWDPGSVRRRGEYICAFFSCEHSACFLLTRQQLRAAIDSGGFLVAPHRGKYDLACTASTDPYTQCGFKKLICISHISDFLVHHLPNKYVGTRFGIDDPEFRRQLHAVLRIAENGRSPLPLLPTETRLTDGSYSKDYYEPAREDVLSVIPKGTCNVLSVGCGSGNTEARLVQKGVRVVALPLDTVISEAATAKGVLVVEADFEGAREKLAGQRFDCLLLQNVLHLMSDPREMLSSYAHLLSKNAAVIAQVPNLLSAHSIWKSIRTGDVLKQWGGYEKTGVQFTHLKLVRKWFESTGMVIQRLLMVGADCESRGRAPMLGRFLSSAFIIVARKV